VASHDPILAVDFTDRQASSVVLTGEGAALRCSRSAIPAGPAVMHLGADGLVSFGAPAVATSFSEPEGTATQLASFLGLDHPFDVEDPSLLPFPLPRPAEHGFELELAGRPWSVSALAAHWLAHLRTLAGDAVGQPVSVAGISYPCWYSARARNRLVTAAKAAGFERVHALPSAAAAAIALHDSGERGVIGWVLHDVGSAAVAWLDLADDAVEVVRYGARSVPAGSDLTTALARFVSEPLDRDLAVDARTRPRSVVRLRAACDRALASLRANPKAHESVSVPFLALAASGPRHLESPIDLDGLRELARPLTEAFEAELAAVFKGADPKALERWVLAGDSPSLTFLAQLLRTRQARNVAIDPGRTPWSAMGAGIHAARREGRASDVFLLQVAPRAIGVRNPDGGVLRFIDRFAPLPATVSGPYPAAALGREPVELVEGDVERADQGVPMASFRLPTSGGPRQDFRRVELVVEAGSDGKLGVAVRSPGSLESVQLEPTPDSAPATGDVVAEVERLAGASRDRELLSKTRLMLDGQSLLLRRMIGEGRFRGSVAGERRAERAAAEAHRAIRSADLEEMHLVARGLGQLLRGPAGEGNGGTVPS